MVVLILVSVAAAAGVTVVMFMLMSVAAAAGAAVVMTVCRGVFTAAGTVMVVLMCMSMAAAAGIIVTVLMLMPVLRAAFLFPGGTVFSGTCSRVDFHARLYSGSCLADLIQKCIRILRCDAQLTGRKCERYLLNLGHRRDLSLHCCRTVGAVQIFNNINFLF